MVLSNSGTMWHLGVACPELLLCVWEAVPQTRIEGSLQLQPLLPSEKSSSNLHSMKQQGLAKAALNQIKTILSYLFHDAVLIFPQRARANENFSAEKNQLVLAACVSRQGKVLDAGKGLQGAKCPYSCMWSISCAASRAPGIGSKSRKKPGDS